MAEVKWIKISTNIFDDEAIKLIEQMPEGDAIIVIWFKLLAKAGKTNNGGLVYFKEDIPYTEEMLATVFNKPLATVRMALKVFETFGMIEITSTHEILIANWEKHQNIDGLEKIREQNRKRVAKHREEKRKLLMKNNICQYCGKEATGFDHIIPIARGGKDTQDNLVECCIECNRIKNDKPLLDFLNGNRDRINDDIVMKNEKLKKYVMLCNVTNHYIETECNAIDIDKDIDIEEEKDIDNNIIISDDNKSSSEPISKGNSITIKEVKEFVNAYNSICVRLSKVEILSDARTNKIKARLKDADIEKWKKVFERIEASDFCCGINNRNWKASFDWIITNDNNYVKVLEGKYDNNKSSSVNSKSSLEELKQKGMEIL